jgi:hypothetical protein
MILAEKCSPTWVSAPIGHSATIGTEVFCDTLASIVEALTGLRIAIDSAIITISFKRKFVISIFVLGFV